MGLKLDKVELLWLEVSAQCGCGEPLARGEQVGFEPTAKELLCLWCLADLTAGRPRPRRRPPRAVPSEGFGSTALHAHVPRTTAAGAATTGPANTGWAHAGWTNTEATNTEATNPRPPLNAAEPDLVTPYRATWQPAPTRRSRRRSGPSTASSLVVAILLVALALVGIPRLLGSTRGATAGAPSALGNIAMGSPITPVAPSESSTALPPVPSDARAARLSPSPLARSSSTDYAFLRTTPSGEPVAFDPCRPIHLVVNSDESPRGGDRLIEEAVEQVSAATGLVLTVDGGTSETPLLRRPSVDQRRYGNRWAPVLVAWTHDSANSELAGPVVGIGGPAMAPFRNPSDMHYVTGGVLLDAPDFERILDQPDGRDIARAIVMHELGHLVGLGHVADQHQLMFESMVGQTDFADGDLEGLRRVGSGPCFSR
jgi:hypothetical protein